MTKCVFKMQYDDDDDDYYNNNNNNNKKKKNNNNNNNKYNNYNNLLVLYIMHFLSQSRKHGYSVKWVAYYINPL